MTDPYAETLRRAQVAKNDGGWLPRCDCGEPAEQTLVYTWDGTEERRRAVCPAHYRKACDTYADMKRNRPGQLSGFRMVTA